MNNVEKNGDEVEETDQSTQFFTSDQTDSLTFYAYPCEAEQGKLLLSGERIRVSS